VKGSPTGGALAVGLLTVLLAGSGGLPLSAAVDGAGSAEAASRFEGRELAEVLRELQSEGVGIVFSGSLVTAGMRVAAEPAGGEPRALLDELLAPHGLAVAEEPAGAWVVVRTAAPPGRLVGSVVVWSAEGEPKPVPRARVALSSQEGSTADLETRCDSEGRFVFPVVAPGAHWVEVRQPGFTVERREIEVESGAETEITVEGVEVPVAVDEIVVTPSAWGLLHSEPESRHFLSRTEVERLPHLSEDLFRAAALLPGNSGGDISAPFYVRGGESDEILLLVDGLEIYEPFHLKDFQSLFSIIDSKAVGSLDFLAGGFPAEYGGRMSGVMDIASAVPSQETRTGLGVSFLNARVSNEGTFDSQRGGWLVSARRGYLDFVLDWAASGGDYVFSPEYYDLLAKVDYQVSERTLLAVNVLAAYDDTVFFEEEHDYPGDDDMQAAKSRYGNDYLWLTASTSWTPGLHSRTIVAAGRVDHRRTVSLEDGAGRTSCTICEERTTRIFDDRNLDFVEVKQDWTWAATGRALIQAGIDLRSLSSDYQYSSFSSVLNPLVTGSNVPIVETLDLDFEPSGSQLGAYGSARLRLTSDFVVELGGRWDRQEWVSGGAEWSPRLNLVYEPSRRTAIRAGWGLYRQAQGLHELQVEDGVTTFFPAQRSEQRLVSVEQLLRGDWRLRVEGYEKRLSRLHPRFENLFEPIDVVPEGAPDRVRIDADRGRARGLELMAQSPPARHWSGWLSYALAAVEDEVDGRWVPRSWDQRHTARFSLNYRRGERWNLNLVGLWRSGWPTTPVTAELVDGPQGTSTIVPSLGERNSARFPSYRRFDLRVSRRVDTRRGALTFFVELTNFLARNNVRAISEFDYAVQPDGSVRVLPEEQFWLGFLPSFGVHWQL
jgi:hypothetical protein